MLLKASGKELKLFDFNAEKHNNWMIALSGGTDSALMLWFTCKLFPNKRIVCHTGTDTSKDPFVGDYAEDIVIWMRKQFPNVNIQHELYKFNSMELHNIEKARKEVEEAEEKGESWKMPTVFGHAKAVASKELKSQIRIKHNITMSAHGITKNPPIEVQEQMGFTHVAEGRRNHDYDILTYGKLMKSPKITKVHVKPFVQVDKKWVAGMYEKLGLMNELFPMTAALFFHQWPTLRHLIMKLINHRRQTRFSGPQLRPVPNSQPASKECQQLLALSALLLVLKFLHAKFRGYYLAA